GYHHLPRRAHQDRHTALRGIRDRRRRRLAPPAGRHPARHPLDHRAAAHPAARLGLHRRLRAVLPAARRRRCGCRRGARHVRLLQRDPGRRLGVRHRRGHGPQRGRPDPDRDRELAGQTVRRGGNLLMTLTNPDAARQNTSGLTADTTIASVIRRRRRDSDRPVWMEEPPLAIKILKAITLAWIVVIMIFPLVYVIAVSFSSAE